MPFDKKDPGMAMYVKIRGDGMGRKAKGNMFKEEMKKNGSPMDEMMGEETEAPDMETIHKKVIAMLKKSLEMLEGNGEYSDEEDESEDSEEPEITE